MNSPDMNRLAAALAKLDDPDIIALLLEAYTPAAKQTEPEPSPLSLPSPAATKGGYRMVDAPNKNHKWTPGDDRWLLDLIAFGCDDADIADRMGRSIRSITSRRKRITGVWK